MYENENVNTQIENNDNDWRYRDYKSNGFYADDATYKAEDRYDRAEDALDREMERQEKQAARKERQSWKNQRDARGFVNDVTGTNARRQRRESSGSIIENLGYRAEDRGKPTAADKLLQKYFNAKQRTGIYIGVAVVAIIMIALKMFGVL